MSRTVTPTGNQSIYLAGIAWLIASSANFQALTGSASAAAALVHVPTESDDSETTGSTRPRAIVASAGSFKSNRISLNQFRPSGAVWVSFEFAPSAAVHAEGPLEDRLWDEMTEFLNRVDLVLTDVVAANGTGLGYLQIAGGESQVAFDSFELIDGPFQLHEVRGEGSAGENPAYCYAEVFEFAWLH